MRKAHGLQARHRARAGVLGKANGFWHIFAKPRGQIGAILVQRAHHSTSANRSA
jgi:hypothetical protein